MPAPASRAVLVVDDDPGALQLVTEALSADGYDVAQAGSGTAALEKARGREFGIIISDQKMPGLSGLEFFRQVRDLQPDASRVLVTGVVDMDTIIKAINDGEVYRFLVKPWLRDELLATVRDASQRHDLIGQNIALKARVEQTIAELGERCRELEQRNRALQGQVAQLLELVGDQKEMIARAIYNERGELRGPSR
ncbi:MAG TPA: response regulator [Verrucomicrobiae bacterium]|nr:response regulator [Verrucomicrobiae bacterium]